MEENMVRKTGGDEQKEEETKRKEMEQEKEIWTLTQTHTTNQTLNTIQQLLE